MVGLWPILRRCPLGTMPLTKAAGPDAWIRNTGGALMNLSPTWISFHLVQTERRQVISFPWVKTIWHSVLQLEITTRWCGWVEIEAIGLIRWWGHGCLWQPSVITWSSGTRNCRCANASCSARLLIICLESLNSVTSTCIAARIWRNHWGSNRTPNPCTGTVNQKKILFKLKGFFLFEKREKGCFSRCLR